MEDQKKIGGVTVTQRIGTIESWGRISGSSVGGFVSFGVDEKTGASKRGLVYADTFGGEDNEPTPGPDDLKPGDKLICEVGREYRVMEWVVSQRMSARTVSAQRGPDDTWVS